MDYSSLYPSVIAPYSGLKLYGSRNHETDAFLPYYATEKDLLEINKFFDAWKYKPGSDLIDVLFADKVNATKFSILHLISRVRERQTIKKRNLEKIDYDVDKFKTELAQIEDLRIYNEIFDLDNKKTRIGLTQKISGLKKEKRAEETSCWRDLTQLRKELMDLIKEYRTASRKKELISSPQGYSLEAKIGNDKYS